MTENDYIAEYIKEKRPEIISTFSFHLWKLGRVMKNIGNNIKAVLSHDKEGGDEDDQECGYRSDVCDGEEGEEDTYSEWSGWNSETDET